MEFKCRKCGKILKFPEEINYFGRNVMFPEELEDKKVWCREHFEDLKEYFKNKRQEETIPFLRIEANTLLSECEKNKKKFIEIIKQTKRFLTSLKNIEHEPELNFEKQATFGDEKC